MKINLLTGFLALSVLTGCAQLGSMLQPEVDPQLVATDSTLKAAPTDIESFLNYVKANPHIVGKDASVSAKGLTDRYQSNLLNLKNTRKLYAANRTDENLSLLKRAKESVDRDRNEAVSQLNGNTLPERGQGAPFAPPQGPVPPPTQTVVLNQGEIVNEIRALKDTVSRGFYMLQTNLAGVNTNTPAIPGK